jgi:hypothetical protein
MFAICLGREFKQGIGLMNLEETDAPTTPSARNQAVASLAAMTPPLEIENGSSEVVEPVTSEKLADPQTRSAA